MVGINSWESQEENPILTVDRKTKNLADDRLDWQLDKQSQENEEEKDTSNNFVLNRLNEQAKENLTQKGAEVSFIKT